MFYLWMTEHRGLAYGLLCAAIWVAAYLVYFSRDYNRYRLDHRPHKWSVDLVTKAVTGQRQKSTH